jgi:hypothetical protein
MTESNTQKRITITFAPEKLERLRNAKKLFEGDLKKNIEMDDFLDMLVKAYLSYRDTRGATESSLLNKLAEK